MFIFSQTWLAPFFYLAVMLAIYLFAPQARRAELQQQMKSDPNFYLVSNIVLIPLAIWATMAWRHAWIDYFTWGMLVVLLVASILRALKPPAPAEPDEPPPL